MEDKAENRLSQSSGVVLAAGTLRHEGEGRVRAGRPTLALRELVGQLLVLRIQPEEVRNSLIGACVNLRLGAGEGWAARNKSEECQAGDGHHRTRLARAMRYSTTIRLQGESPSQCASAHMVCGHCQRGCRILADPRGRFLTDCSLRWCAR